MTGLGLNAIFISYPGGFSCSNNGTIEVESDIINDFDGDKKGVRRTKLLKLKNAFTHRLYPSVGQQVTCLTRINTGNIFHYEGFVSYISDDGHIGVKLASNAQVDRTEEIIKTIAES